MRDFVIAIAEQARSAASGFFTIPQNELELLTIDGYPDSDLAAEYFAVLDGVGQEALSFGYTADAVSTPQEDHERLLAFLDRVKVAARRSSSAIAETQSTSRRRAPSGRRTDSPATPRQPETWERSLSPICSRSTRAPIVSWRSRPPVTSSFSSTRGASPIDARW
ncbi:MAG: hypothetical protein NTX23_03250 [Candidatus Bipolaricaulota bacterium]|nr:hypothetical protein [Candidatus Bipolaricaulota bacterium]